MAAFAPVRCTSYSYLNVLVFRSVWVDVYFLGMNVKHFVNNLYSVTFLCISKLFVCSTVIALNMLWLRPPSWWWSSIFEIVMIDGACMRLSRYTLSKEHTLSLQPVCAAWATGAEFMEMMKAVTVPPPLLPPQPSLPPHQRALKQREEGEFTRYDFKYTIKFLLRCHFHEYCGLDSVLGLCCWSYFFEMRLSWCFLWRPLYFSLWSTFVALFLLLTKGMWLLSSVVPVSFLHEDRSLELVGSLQVPEFIQDP